MPAFPAGMRRRERSLGSAASAFVGGLVTVESRYNGSKSNGNPPKTNAVFQSFERNFLLFL